MNIWLLAFSVTLGLGGPALAVHYLRPILLTVLRGLCTAEGSAEFWIRCAYLLAMSGTLLLVLSLGQFEGHVDPVDALLRTLSLVLAGVFASVAIVSSRVWKQVAAQAISVQPAGRAQ